MKGIKGTGKRSKADYQRAYRMGRRLKAEREKIAARVAATAGRIKEADAAVALDVSKLIGGKLPPPRDPFLPRLAPPDRGGVSDSLLLRVDDTLQEVETLIRRVRFQIAVYMEYRRVT